MASHDVRESWGHGGDATSRMAMLAIQREKHSHFPFLSLGRHLIRSYSPQSSQFVSLALNLGYDARPIHGLFDPERQIERAELQLGLIVGRPLPPPDYVRVPLLNIGEAGRALAAPQALGAEEEAYLPRGVRADDQRPVPSVRVTQIHRLRPPLDDALQVTGYLEGLGLEVERPPRAEDAQDLLHVRAGVQHVGGQVDPIPVGVPRERIRAVLHNNVVRSPGRPPDELSPVGYMQRHPGILPSTSPGEVLPAHLDDELVQINVIDSLDGGVLQDLHRYG